MSSQSSKYVSQRMVAGLRCLNQLIDRYISNLSREDKVNYSTQNWLRALKRKYRHLYEDFFWATSRCILLYKHTCLVTNCVTLTCLGQLYDWTILQSVLNILGGSMICPDQEMFSETHTSRTQMCEYMFVILLINTKLRLKIVFRYN